MKTDHQSRHLTVFALLAVIAVIGAGIADYSLRLKGSWPGLDHYVASKLPEREGSKAELTANSRRALDYILNDITSPGYVPLSGDAELPELPPVSKWKWDEIIVDRLRDDTEIRIPEPGDDSVRWNLKPLDRITEPGPQIMVLIPYEPGSARYINAPWANYNWLADSNIYHRHFSEGIPVKELLEGKPPIIKLELDEPKLLTE
ncbi:MAG: hypothetical protein M3R04_00580 [bacterium]|nr:hypothetical protein [bacterium]